MIRLVLICILVSGPSACISVPDGLVLTGAIDSGLAGWHMRDVARVQRPSGTSNQAHDESHTYPSDRNRSRDTYATSFEQLRKKSL